MDLSALFSQTTGQDSENGSIADIGSNPTTEIRPSGWGSHSGVESSFGSVLDMSSARFAVRWLTGPAAAVEAVLAVMRVSRCFSHVAAFALDACL